VLLRQRTCRKHRGATDMVGQCAAIDLDTISGNSVSTKDLCRNGSRVFLAPVTFCNALPQSSKNTCEPMMQQRLCHSVDHPPDLAQARKFGDLFDNN
jgi:hypothetical protein